MDGLVQPPVVPDVLGQGTKNASVVVESGLQVDLRIVANDPFGAIPQYFTGSQQHNIRLREYANRRGLSLNEYGITTLDTDNLEKYADEGAFYERLDLKDTHVLRAREVGVPLMISTDSHAHKQLVNIQFGVAVARRGLCEAKKIVNSLVAEHFLTFIRSPKPQRISLLSRGA